MQKAEIAEKRLHLHKKKIRFHQDNARRFHSSAVAIRLKIQELLFEMLLLVPSSENCVQRTDIFVK
jgi:hypothetical protein